MTAEELAKIPRREPQSLLADESPLIAITVELNVEWWRGYCAAKAEAPQSLSRVTR